MAENRTGKKDTPFRHIVAVDGKPDDCQTVKVNGGA